LGISAPTVVFPAPGRVEIWTVELPDLGPNDVLLRTVCSGVSQGTERWVLTDRYRWANGIPQYPHFPGYQAAGVVEEVGSDVEDLGIGDHVFSQGTPFADRTARYGLASHTGFHIASRSAVTKLDPSLDLASASLLRMAGVARHGVRLTGVREGDLVAVIGQGLIGQMSAQAARRHGARVIASDLVPARVEVSEKHSADRAVDASTQDLGEAVREEAPDGADVVIETTGNARLFLTCVDLVQREGRICLQGYYPDLIEVDFHPTHLKRPSVTFPCWVDEQEDAALADDLARGEVVIEPLITHRIPYTDAADAFDLVVEHPERTLGMVLTWEGA
jgi:2-desacetyl-2-hydroxyethyl bacteriochlorophyllide A dehydrogenase